MQSVNELSPLKITRMGCEKFHEINELLYFITHTYTMLKSFQSKQEAFLNEPRTSILFIPSLIYVSSPVLFFFLFFLFHSLLFCLFSFFSLYFFSNCFVLNTIMSVLPLERWIDFRSEGPAISQISDRKSAMSRHK